MVKINLLSLTVYLAIASALPGYLGPSACVDFCADLDSSCMSLAAIGQGPCYIWGPGSVQSGGWSGSGKSSKSHTSGKSSKSHKSHKSHKSGKSGKKSYSNGWRNKRALVPNTAANLAARKARRDVAVTDYLTGLTSGFPTAFFPPDMFGNGSGKSHKSKCHFSFKAGKSWKSAKWSAKCGHWHAKWSGKWSGKSSKSGKSGSGHGWW